MPQIFQVLKCFRCLVFQVHQTKKSNKWECKLCGEKQSIKRHYGVGTAKDCRIHVQKLNGIRGEFNQLKDSEYAESDDELESVDTNKKAYKVADAKSKKSKWSDYIEKSEDMNECNTPEAMYLGDTEVVLEVPKKRKKNNFKCPVVNREVREMGDDQCENECNNTNKLLLEKVLRSNDDANYNITLEPKNLNITDKTIMRTEINENMNDEMSRHLQITNVDKKAYKLPSVKTNSKWAQFIQEDATVDDTSDGNDNYELKTCSNVPIHNYSKKIFSLCDESDLDSILDI